MSSRTAPRTSPTPPASQASALRAAARESADAVWRSAILAAATDEFTERGYAAARMVDVARRAGLSVGGLYRYFGSKEALFGSLMERADADIVRRLADAQRASPDPAERLRLLIETLLAFIEENRAMFMVFQQLGDADRAASRELFERSEATRARVLAAFHGALSDGVACGALRDDVEVDAQLAYVTGAIHGFLERWVRTGAHRRLSDQAALVAALSLRALAPMEAR